jgi:hypothetical protein
MKRILVLGAVVATALGMVETAGAQRSTRECNGLDVCIRVPGPFVAVPAASAGAAGIVYYELSCPRRSIVGGLDAVLGDLSLDVLFLGMLGSPVNPGITTSRSVVFVATYARSRPTYFRPLLGCIPTSGGGGRSTTSVVQRPRPPVRRVRVLRVRAGASQSMTHGCRSGERLVGSSHAVAFRTRRLPPLNLFAGVSTSLAERGNRIVVSARRSVGIPARMRVEVQVHALCARGPA